MGTTEIPGASLTILGVFLMGLGLNLTPCVYPMLTVTVSLFGKGKAASRRSAFLKALAYVAGIAVMYSSLGVLAAMTGEILGSVLQNRWVLGGIGAVLFLLALSAFGVYAIPPPQALLEKFSRNSRTNLLGWFAAGMFVGVFAAPCIGPPLVALLTFVGTRKDPVFGFWIFFVLSLGLGLPYLVLGTFSGLIRHIPRSGAWLAWVEKLFGILLLSLSAFYFILAVDSSWLTALPPAALVLGGFYLGFIDLESGYSKRFIQIKKTLGILAVLAGLIGPFFMPKNSVVWEPYAPEKLEQARMAGKPVIIDGYADWCIPCHEMEQLTYTDERVIQALDGFVRLKLDLTDPDKPETRILIQQYQLVGVPVMLFFKPDGKEMGDV